MLVSITVAFSFHYVSRISALGEMDYIWLTETITLGRPLSLLVGGCGAFVTVLLWVNYRPIGRWKPGFGLFLLLAALTWLIAAWLSVTRGSPFDVSLLGVPLVLLMIWFKPIPVNEVMRAIDLWALSVVCLSIAFIILQGAEFVVTSDPSLYSRRWSIPTPFGTLVERWAGHLGNVNFSGSIGAAILVYGITRAGVVRGISVTGGLVILILSESRSAIAAALVGVFVFLVTLILKRKQFRFVAVCGVATITAIPIFGFFLLDPSLNGRTTIWVNSVNAWWESPIFGDQQESSITGSSHNLLIDIAFHFGLAGALPMLAAMTVLTFLVAKTTQGGPAFVLPLFAMVLVSNSMDRFISVYYITPR